MTKRWSSTTSDLTKTKRRASKERRLKDAPKVLMVTDSCGCVFCDLDIAPNASTSAGQPAHQTRSGIVPCLKD